VPALVVVVLGSLTPFFCWAVLTALAELHWQGETTLEVLRDLRRASRT